jgi:GMP synthase-like glutamine amidotransferase
VRVLVLRHAENEGPGTLGTFLESHGVELVTVDLFDGCRPARGAQGFAAIVSMGGPMNVYEEDRHPFLAAEDALARDAVARGVPFFGICLGAQILAKACGARVARSPAPEIGFSRVRLTPEGRRDPLFSGVGEEIDVFQWHEDAFDVPEGGVLLARGEACPNQAFRVGPAAYGLQFHVEVTPAMVGDWFGEGPRGAREIEAFRAIGGRFRAKAEVVFLNLLGTVLRGPGAGGAPGQIALTGAEPAP